MSGREFPSAGGYVHASAVMIGGHGILIRGRSGAGKSALADALIAEGLRRGLRAMLVGDDRVALGRADGGITLTGHPAIAGLIERRGIGIEAIASAGSARLALVVDLALTHEAGMRDRPCMLHGMAFPRLALPENMERTMQVEAILDELAGE